MRQYLELLQRIMVEGRDRDDRTGTGTRAVFGAQMRFDLREGFPLITTKKLFTKGIFHELLWMLSGSTQVGPLQAAGVKIWNEWSTAEQCARFGREAGDLGPSYAHQWRNAGATVCDEKCIAIRDGHQVCEFGPLKNGYHDDGIDQIARVVEQIKTNPNSRRLIVSAWSPKEADEVALPPCHSFFQFSVSDGELSLALTQRSGDMFLGIPFNIASYALLMSMVAQVTGLRPRYFVHTINDAHIYRNHFDQVQEQLAREPRDLPRLALNPEVNDLFAFRYEDIAITGYDPHPHIKAEVSV